jgi:hypothetical protein
LIEHRAIFAGAATGLRGGTYPAHAKSADAKCK